MNKRVVVVDDNQVIKIWVYHDALGVAAEVTPQRALHIASQLLEAALRHLSRDTTLNDPATGIKLFP